MTFKLDGSQVTVGDTYHKDGQLREVVSIEKRSTNHHGTYYQLVYQSGTLTGCDVIKPGEVVEVVQHFETK
jgi:hypothetical protein